jgi:hypothetical protein
VGGKSLSRGGIKGKSGGITGHKLGRLEIQAIVIEGKGKDWKILRFDSEGTL